MKWENDTFLETYGTSGIAERDFPTFDKWYKKTSLHYSHPFLRPSGSKRPKAERSRDSKSMEKDQLISMIHFLVKREDERAQENQELKDMVKELRDTHKQDVKTQTNLLKSIDNLTNQVADLTTQNRMISERIAELAQALPSRD